MITSKHTMINLSEYKCLVLERKKTERKKKSTHRVSCRFCIPLHLILRISLFYSSCVLHLLNNRRRGVQMGFLNSCLMRSFSQLPPAEPCSYICPILITKEQTTGLLKVSSVITLSHQVKQEYQKKQKWGGREGDEIISLLQLYFHD